MLDADEMAGAVRADADGSGPEAARPLEGVIGRQGRRPAALLLQPGEGAFRLALLDGEDAPLLFFGPYGEEEVVARWRALGAASGLPLALPGVDGGVELPYPQLGRLQLGRVRDRRRLVVLTSRRPRFLRKRKLARLPVRPLVHREREIAIGRGA